MEDRFRFRLYDKEKGLMLYEDSEILRTEKVYEYEELWWANVAFPIKAISRFFDYNSGERFVLQQCTGLKDKNGKLIYEGDIVKVGKWDLVGTDLYYEKKDEYIEETGIVKWDKSKFDVFYLNDIKCNIYLPECRDILTQAYVEVIGNIYENKDLLKEEK